MTARSPRRKTDWNAKKYSKDEAQLFLFTDILLLCRQHVVTAGRKPWFPFFRPSQDNLLQLTEEESDVIGFNQSYYGCDFVPFFVVDLHECILEDGNLFLVA